MEHLPGGTVAIARWIPVEPLRVSDTPASLVIAPLAISTSRLSDRVMIHLLAWCDGDDVMVCFWLRVSVFMVMDGCVLFFES